MLAIEFETDIESGVIRIPHAYKHVRQPPGLNTISINLK